MGAWPKLALWGILVPIAAALVSGGCGGAREGPGPAPVTLTVYVPCVLSDPLRKAAQAYEAGHPGVTVVRETYKPLALPGAKFGPPASGSSDRAAEGPAVVVTAGDTEMAALVRGGIVGGAEVHTFASNAWPLAVVAPAEGPAALATVADLGGPALRRLYLEDPAQSSLGRAARQAFESLGLWSKVGAKVVHPEPGRMVLADLLAGKADAAVVFEDCLLGEGGEGEPPKTIRVIGRLSAELLPAIPFQAAPMISRPRQEIAREFVKFLAGAEGREILRAAGLKPAR